MRFKQAAYKANVKCNVRTSQQPKANVNIVEIEGNFCKARTSLCDCAHCDSYLLICTQRQRTQSTIIAQSVRYCLRFSHDLVPEFLFSPSVTILTRSIPYIAKQSFLHPRQCMCISWCFGMAGAEAAPTHP